MEENKILKTYLRRLTNLGSSNRSLLLLRLANEQLIDLHKLSFLEKKNSFSIIESLIAGKSHPLCAVTDARMELSNDMSRKLKRLSRIDELIYEERGSKDLHVAWPILRGKFNDGTPVRAPLIFFPVKLVQERGKWILHLREEAEVSFNKAFLLAYAFFNQVQPDENLMERSFEDFDTDKDVFRSSLYEALKESLVELDFNAENFRDELQFFEEYNKENFQEQMEIGRIKLCPEAVIGIFPQASTQLVPDYTELIKNKNLNDLEAFFYERSPAKQEAGSSFDLRSVQQKIKEEKLFTAFALDAHQELAIKAIKSGNSLVVQGPPGTGKSQLICNLISDAMANGKRVLVVCQKRAALDVVHQRLKEKDLSDFLGLVHDYRHDRSAVYKKISNQIERLDEYRQRNNSLDAIQLERNYLHTCRRIDQITEELEEFRLALFDESACGVSAKEMYLNSSPHNQAVNLKQEFRFFDLDNATKFWQKLKSYHAYATLFLRADYLLSDRKSFSGFKISDLKKYIHAINDLVSFQKERVNEISGLVGGNFTIQEAEEILSRRELAVEMLGALRLDTVFNYFKRMEPEDDTETSLLWLENIERILLDCFADDGPEITLSANQLGRFQETLKRSMDARKSLIKMIRWELFSQDKFLVKRVLVANKLKQNKEGFKQLLRMMDNRLNLEHNITKLKTKSWLRDFPETYDKSSWEQWLQKQKMALRAKLIFSFFKSLRVSINVQQMDFAKFKMVVERLFELLQEIPQKKEQWQEYLTSTQINRLLQHPESSEKIIQQVSKDFDALCEFDKLSESFESHEMSTIVRLYEILSPDDAYENFRKVFINSTCIAWLEHLEEKYPVLRSVSSLRLSQMENELQDLVLQKQDISTDIILMRAREKIYEEVEFNRLRNRVTYRDLHHQVTKKKRIWPLRKLVAEFSDELFKLMPCWLASPETVSAIFPMQSFFDLVIFDEASQCFAERGIPAMYRGRQVLIAGDDKQLKPFDLYKIRWEDEEEIAELEVDSLLDLSSKYLMQVQLKGHYRSLRHELIDFSNQHFYGNDLQFIPNRLVHGVEDRPILFEKVEGIWEDNTNLSEAEHIVGLVEELIKNIPNKSIGIISFNAPQQMLIMDLLEKHFEQKRITRPESLMVKNIENVQGDEKDIIIFSLAYAPGKKGKMMMQFGSLNMAGGENRLNVAISRAREKIIVVSSILPNQLNVDDVKNEGPKLLKEYLQYAYDVANGIDRNIVPRERQHTASWYLANKLINALTHNHEHVQFLMNELPHADISIKKAGLNQALVLTDDEYYHAALSSKEMHAYLPLILKSRNWPNHRVYSREWWFDKDKVLNQLGGFIVQHAEKPEE